MRLLEWRFFFLDCTPVSFSEETLAGFLCAKLAADKREDQERQRKLLKNKAIAYLGNKRAPSDPPLDPKVPVLSSSEAVAVMETIPTNLRVDPVGETNAERKEEVASWFATNRGLLRHIFQTKGTRE